MFEPKSWRARLDEALTRRQADVLYRHRQVRYSPQGTRQITHNRDKICFCSNDYLGLANHPKLKAAFSLAIEDMGVGAGSAHLINGHTRYHAALEARIADFFNCERALLFSSGYMANVGCISALCARNDIVFYDKRNHASLIDGINLSQARAWRYHHNNMAHCATLCQKHPGEHRFLISDGVFSMDGDVAPIHAITQLAQEAQLTVIIDDAHGIGVIGQGARGLTATHPVPVLIGTLGKALGCYGAFVAGSSALIEYLIQFARPYIYTTACPPAVAAAALAAFDIISHDDTLQTRLQANIALFHHQMAQHGIPLAQTGTPIIPITIGENRASIRMANSLFERGYLVTAIRPPSVKPQTARLRITLSAQHHESDIYAFTEVLAEMIHQHNECNDYA